MTDDWETPDWLWGDFPDFYDPSPPNTAEFREFDGLSPSAVWGSIIVKEGFKGLKLNPPHSDPLPWVQNGIRVAEHGIRVIMLLRLDSTTKHHKALIEAGFHPFGAFERIAYGKSENGGRYANVLWFSPGATSGK